MKNRYIVTILAKNVHTGRVTRVNENEHGQDYTHFQAEKLACKLNHFAPVLYAWVEVKIRN